MDIFLSVTDWSNIKYLEVLLSIFHYKITQFDNLMKHNSSQVSDNTLSIFYLSSSLFRGQLNSKFTQVFVFEDGYR